MSTEFSLSILVVIGLLVLWDVTWKAVALWKSARHDQLKWFVAILVLNSAGILPIIYLSFFQKQPEKSSPESIDSQQNNKQ